MQEKNMRLALVYDRLNKWGGAERVLLALHEIWPEAPLYTAVYNPKTASWAKVFKVNTSFMQFLPFAKSYHEIYPFFAPLAFEFFDFSSYEVVLSVTSAEAKGIITQPGTLHICYCLTPTRYLWSGYKEYLEEPGLGCLNPFARVSLKFFAPFLRKWDMIAAKRPDFYLAISKNVKERIEKYYREKAEVVYPPVNTDFFQIKNKSCPSCYFLIVSRLVPYKKIDYAILAFNRLGWPLRIVGKGIDEGRLKKLAKKNVEFVGEISDEELLRLYQNCRAFIFPQEEDFGLSAVEAQACGKPVVAFGGGGAKEVVIPGKTGELYPAQNEESLILALKKFAKKRYSSSLCRQNALSFRKEIFQKQMKAKVEKYWQRWKKRN